MKPSFVETLGVLRVERTLENDLAAPCLEVVHPDGRVMRARALAIPETLEVDVLQAFERRALAASSLRHPSLAVPLVWSSTSPPFVAGVCPSGPSVASLLTGGLDRLAAEQVSGIGLDVAEALTVAHEAGVAHGGVGLSSLVVTAEGRAVLTDFAIAELVAALVNTHSHVLGTAAAYLAPEHLTGTATSSATDVFALGSALYRLLTGAYPFDAPSPLGMTLKLQMGSFDRVESSAPDTPAPLCELISAMLAQAPDARPTAARVASELSYLAQNEEPRRRALRALLGATDVPGPLLQAAPATAAVPVAPLAGAVSAPPAPAPPSAAGPAWSGASASPAAASYDSAFPASAPADVAPPPLAPARVHSERQVDERPTVRGGIPIFSEEELATAAGEPGPEDVALHNEVAIGFDDSRTEVTGPGFAGVESTVVLPASSLPGARPSVPMPLTDLHAPSAPASHAGGDRYPALVWVGVAAMALVILVGTFLLAVALAR